MGSVNHQRPAQSRRPRFLANDRHLRVIGLRVTPPPCLIPDPLTRRIRRLAPRVPEPYHVARQQGMQVSCQGFMSRFSALLKPPLIPDWQLPPGVPRGTWHYAHSRQIAAGYDEVLNQEGSCQLELAVLQRHFTRP